MKILAKLVWITLAVSTAIVAAIVPIAALVGSILIPATFWGWAYNHTLILAIAVGFLGFLSWGFTWAGLIYLVVNKLQGR